MNDILNIHDISLILIIQDEGTTSKIVHVALCIEKLGLHNFLVNYLLFCIILF